MTPRRAALLVPLVLACVAGLDARPAVAGRAVLGAGVRTASSAMHAAMPGTMPGAASVAAAAATPRSTSRPGALGGVDPGRQDGAGERAEGRVVDGRRVGEWTTRYASGALASQGSYVDGLRDGAWHFYHDAPGADEPPLRARGRFDRGLRVKHWTYWSADGEEDPDESGYYAAERGTDAEGRPLFAGERRRADRRSRGEGERHGLWTFYWESGRVQIECELRHGKRTGPLRFWHADGSFDPDFLSGEYVAGVRIGPLADADADPRPSRPASTGEAARPAGPAGPGGPGGPGGRGVPLGPVDLAALATLHAAAERAPAPARAALDRFLAGDDEAADALVAGGDEALAALLLALLPLDFHAPEAWELGGRSHRLVLSRRYSGEPHDWVSTTGRGGAERNARTVRQWLAIWTFARGRPEYTELALPAVAADPERAGRLLRVPPWFARFEAADHAPPPKYAPRGVDGAGGRGSRTARGAGGGGESAARERAIGAALAWLASVQRPDGSWDCNVPDEGWAELSAGDLAQSHVRRHDVGLTGLALLAFLGAGEVPTSERHGAAVTRALVWLLSRQDEATGLFGRRSTQEFLYDHAIATLAVAEAFVLTGWSVLGERAQDGVAFLETARNPYGGWHYAVPPDGSEDTSLTAWCTLALLAARDGGLAVDHAALEGAGATFDRFTDGSTYRVGYSSEGDLGSRLVGMNDAFPAELDEAMTAAALTCRAFLAAGPPAADGAGSSRSSASSRSEPADGGGAAAELRKLMARSASLVARSRPAWEPERKAVNAYFWFFGTTALHQLSVDREKAWESWRTALDAALLEAQRDDGSLAGSWDPVGPWAFAGGRAYTTSLLALCLEWPMRFARVLPRH